MAKWLWFVLLVPVLTGMGYRSYAIEGVVSQTVFYLPDGRHFKPYAEVYWQIAPNTLQFKQVTPGSFVAKIRTEITFRNDTGVVYADKFILQTNPSGSLAEAYRQNITELHQYPLPTGKIKMRLVLHDMADDNNTLTLADSFTIDTLNTTPTYSGIELLDTSFISNEQNAFSKNNRQQIPLCANFIDQWRHTLFFYTELYNTGDIAKADLPLIQTAFVSRRKREAPLYNIKQRDTIFPGGVKTFNDKFDISKLPTGNYYLNIVLENVHNEQVAYTSVFFQRLNKIKDTITAPLSDADTTFEKLNFLDLSTTFVGKYTLPQLKAILKMIRPISNYIERGAIDNFEDRPDENYMRYFIYNFWKSRNKKDPKKAWDEYAEIVKSVNRMFKGELAQGYETDRGQLYLKYGKPNDIITVTSESGVLPYEIWIYNVLPEQSLGGQFLFYRPADFVTGYKLLHSNVKGEVRTPAWRSFLYMTGSSSGNVNSRAEQYFPGNK